MLVGTTGWGGADQPASETFGNCDGNELKATFGTELSDDCLPVSWGYMEARYPALHSLGNRHWLVPEE